LLRRDTPKVRKAALIALEAIGPDLEKTLSKLYQRLLDHWAREEDAAVKQALTKLLKSRLATTNRETLKEALPRLLQHKDADIVLVGLKAVQAKKEKAADAAGDVAGLLNADTPKDVEDEALAALKALGTAASGALPKLFERLGQIPQYQREPLALTAAGMVERKDVLNVKRLVPFLLKGLHPKSLESGSGASKAAINEVLRRFGQPAVDGAIKELNENLNDNNASDKNSSHYRMNLYESIERLGKSCQSKENYESLHDLVKREAKKQFNKEVIDAAVNARKAMDDK
jgi:uncharacterized protein